MPLQKRLYKFLFSNMKGSLQFPNVLENEFDTTLCTIPDCRYLEIIYA